jgi:hypothetical protein
VEVVERLLLEAQALLETTLLELVVQAPMHILLGQRQLLQATADILLVVVAVETLVEQIDMAQVVAQVEAAVEVVKSQVVRGQSTTTALTDRQTLAAGLGAAT